MLSWEESFSNVLYSILLLCYIMEIHNGGIWGLKRIHSHNNNLSSFHSKTHLTFVLIWNTMDLSIHWKFMFKFNLICLWYTTIIYFQKVKIVLCLKNVGLCQCLYKPREQHDTFHLVMLNARTNNINVSWRLRFFDEVCVCEC